MDELQGQGKSPRSSQREELEELEGDLEGDQYFAIESQDLLNRFEQQLFELTTDAQKSEIQGLMRTTHTLKGAAANVGQETILAIAHHLEDLFRGLLSPQAQLNSDLLSMLFEGYDCLRLAVSFALSGELGQNDDLLQRMADLVIRFHEEVGDDFTQQSPVAAATELGFDITQSIFEMGVTQRIEELDELLSGGQDVQEVQDYLQEMVEVFGGLGDSLELPGFQSLTDAIALALKISPDHTLDVASLALADLKQARQWVLNGDRTSGGKPSPDLLQFTQPTPTATAQNVQESTSLEVTEAIEDIFADPSTPETPEPDSDPLEDIFLAHPPKSPVTEPTEVIEDIVLERYTPPQTETPTDPIEDIFGESPTPPENPVTTPTKAIEDIFADQPSEPEKTLPETSHEVEPLFLEDPVQPPLTLNPENTSQTPISPTISPSPLTASSGIKTTDKLTKSLSQQSLRIELEKLEHLNYLVGELLINQNQLALRDEQVQDYLNQFSELLKKHRLTLNNLQNNLIESTPENSQFYQASHSQKLLTSALEETKKLTQATEEINLTARTTFSTIEKEQRLSMQIRDDLKSARMIPLETILKRFPPMIKQFSRTHQKEVELVLIGTEVTIDKAITETLYDVLLHLIRNAFDHGIESPEIRQKLNKSPLGTIRISAYNQGNRTLIDVQDDGIGLNVSKIAEKAYQQGLISLSEQEELTQHLQPGDRLLDLLCQSGFSTTDRVSDLSGRGVGLDVVKTQLEQIKGSLSMQTYPQKGTTFSIALRDSLMSARLLICQVNQAIYGFISNEIEQVVIPRGQLRLLAGQKVLDWNQPEKAFTIPVYELGTLFHYPSRSIMMGQGISVKNGQNLELNPVLNTPNGISPVLLLNTSEGLMGLEVDRVIEEQEFVIKPISNAIAPPPYIYGCSILADGRLTLVIDGSGLVHHTQKTGTRFIQQTPFPPQNS